MLGHEEEEARNEEGSLRNSQNSNIRERANMCVSAKQKAQHTITHWKLKMLEGKPKM